MGVNYAAYLGPVLTLKNKFMDIEVEQEKTTCPNNHKVDSGDIFCKKCGEKTILTKTKEIKNVNIYKTECDEGTFDNVVNYNEDEKSFIFDHIGISITDFDTNDYFNVSEETLAKFKNYIDRDEEAIYITDD